MKDSTYIGIALTVALIGASILPAINYRIDTARVLTRNFDTKYEKIEGNVAFLKVAWILKNKDKYDSFLVGSSRVRYGMPADALGDRWYKLEYPGAYIGEHLYNLSLLSDQKVKISRVILALDDFAIYGKRDNKNDYFYRLYPKGLADWLDFYRFYLFKIPQKTDLRVLKGKRRIEKVERYSGERSGISLPDRDTEDHSKFILELPPFDEGMTYEKPLNIEGALEDLKAIKNLCEKIGAKLDIVITPRHYKTFFSRDFFAISKFRKEIAKIQPFWDFSGFSVFNTHPRYWHDVSHFTPDVGKIIIETIEAKREPEPDFGFYVTEKNSDLFYSNLYKQAVMKLPDLMKKDAMLSPHDCFLKKHSDIPTSKIRFSARSAEIETVNADNITDRPNILGINMVCPDKSHLIISTSRGSYKRNINKGFNRIFIKAEHQLEPIILETSKPLDFYPSSFKAGLYSFIEAEN